MLYGAIISKETCLFTRVDEENKKVIKVYRSKISSLPLDCNYQPILTSLQRLEGAKGNEVKEIASVLEKQNKNLLDENCPVVF